MTLEEQIELLESNAEFERKNGNLQGCLNFRILADWLKDYKRLLKQQDDSIKYFETINKLSQTCGMPYSFVEAKVKNAAKTLKALKQEPCDDAISRHAVLEMAYDMSEIDGEHFTEQCMVVDIEGIKKLPSVTPQQKIGQWIKGRYKDTCDKCRCTYPKDIGFKNYCPNCGCKMTEIPTGEESETQHGSN